MKICPNCHAELNDDALFCKSCGSAVSAAPSSGGQAQNAAVTTQSDIPLSQSQVNSQPYNKPANTAGSTAESNRPANTPTSPYGDTARTGFYEQPEAPNQPYAVAPMPKKKKGGKKALIIIGIIVGIIILLGASYLIFAEQIKRAIMGNAGYYLYSERVTTNKILEDIGAKDISFGDTVSFDSEIKIKSERSSSEDSIGSSSNNNKISLNADVDAKDKKAYIEFEEKDNGIKGVIQYDGKNASAEITGKDSKKSNKQVVDLGKDDSDFDVISFANNYQKDTLALFTEFNSEVLKKSVISKEAETGSEKYRGENCDYIKFNVNDKELENDLKLVKEFVKNNENFKEYLVKNITALKGYSAGAFDRYLGEYGSKDPEKIADKMIDSICDEIDRFDPDDFDKEITYTVYFKSGTVIGRVVDYDGDYEPELYTEVTGDVINAELIMDDKEHIFSLESTVKDRKVSGEIETDEEKYEFENVGFQKVNSVYLPTGSVTYKDKANSDSRNGEEKFEITAEVDGNNYTLDIKENSDFTYTYYDYYNEPAESTYTYTSKDEMSVKIEFSDKPEIPDMDFKGGKKVELDDFLNRVM